MRKNQKGFSAVEGLLVLIIAGLIGFVGWYVWTAKQKTANVSTNSAVGTESTAKRLCYIKNNKAECYKDSSFSSVSNPVGFNDLNIVNIVPSPNDDRLALLTGSGTGGNMEIYVTDAKLNLTKLNIGDYKKDTYSLDWLKDASGLVFEADANKSKTTRIIVRYNFADQKIKELTTTDTLSAEPHVSDNVIVFQRYDLAANPSSAWQWHKMNIDGQNDVDLGLNVGYGGVVRSGKLIDTVSTSGLVEVDIATKKQKTLNVKLDSLTSTGSGLISLDDGRLVFTYKEDPNNPGPYDKLAVANLTNGKTIDLDIVGVSQPFQTGLLSN